MNNRRILKILILILIIITVIKLYFNYQYYPFLLYHNKKIVEFIKSFHPYDDIVFVAIQVLQVLVAGAIPAEISGFVGGYLYGPVVGTIYSTIGLSIGSWLAFILSRAYGFPLVRRVVKQSIMNKYDHFIEARGPLVCLILFLIPGFPKAALCYILGLSHMNIWTFVGVSTVGRLLGTILLSLSGDSVRTMRITVLLIILGTVAILYITIYLYRHKLLEITLRQKKRK